MPKESIAVIPSGNIDLFMGRSFLFGMLLRDLHSSTGLDRPAYTKVAHG
jgi:hypothetical protein